ncbi:MAG: aspartate-semialdehyde dehydrogenase [Actinomycetota bacterium]
MSSLNVAVVGATGAVGTELLRILEQREFPLASLRPIASARSAGRKLSFNGEEITVEEISEGAFSGIELAIFDTPDEVSAEWVPKARDLGVVCVDKSAAFRQDPEVPLVIPEINASALSKHKGIVANPNCTMTTLILPLAPLHRAATARRVVCSSYQSVSGAGVAGVDDLYEQLEKLTPEREAVRSGEVTGLIAEGRAFAHPIAFNVIPHVGSFDAAGSTSEERRVRDETRKILDAPNIDIIATAVRVPTVRAHGISAWVEFEKDLPPSEARSLLEHSDGVEVRDDPEAFSYPTALMASGKDKAFVGRIREGGSSNAISFFSTCDNLRKGAALNAVQIAELLAKTL